MVTYAKYAPISFFFDGVATAYLNKILWGVEELENLDILSCVVRFDVALNK